jgi:hypothetical protein
VIGEICESGTSRDFTFEEVDAMRATKLWSTYRHVRLEKCLLAVPKTEKKALDAYFAGKRTR